MSKHTPGPWGWESGVLCSDKYIIGGNSHSFNASNKKLIAAAPDLLEALELAESVIKNMAEPSNSKQKAILSCRAAIAKAKGES
ncbi:hypothetical protein SOASR014_43480 [Pectobacterium carotovorum subsp. carotovorum]|nr:hypothetical protein SOASR014_43480 [Pectobacterium carotovorum subsp. carotovorum]GLX46729.1 hypothetical protein Pcaca01_43970 [Pectobacterium carotovorum subsp. carotovorum]